MGEVEEEESAGAEETEETDSIVYCVILHAHACTTAHPQVWLLVESVLAANFSLFSVIVPLHHCFNFLTFDCGWQGG